MRTKIILLLLLASAANAGYNISWHTIDGGGGRSSGGQYALTGTIAQPDAAYSAGGNYEILGGFWSGEPLCTVDFYLFARFVEYWMQTGTDLPADLYKDENNIVEYYYLSAFVNEWLYSCPAGWPLK